MKVRRRQLIGCLKFKYKPNQNLNQNQEAMTTTDTTTHEALTPYELYKQETAEADYLISGIDREIQYIETSLKKMKSANDEQRGVKLLPMNFDR